MIRGARARRPCGTLGRANQGHSVDVDVEFPKKQPPVILYHGTGEKYVASIDEQGLIPKSRLYVHLSGDETTAMAVGSRHGRPVIYEVLSVKCIIMVNSKECCRFFIIFVFIMVYYMYRVYGSVYARSMICLVTSDMILVILWKIFMMRIRSLIEKDSFMHILMDLKRG